MRSANDIKNLLREQLVSYHMAEEERLLKLEPRIEKAKANTASYCEKEIEKILIKMTEDRMTYIHMTFLESEDGEGLLRGRVKPYARNEWEETSSMINRSFEIYVWSIKEYLENLGFYVRVKNRQRLYSWYYGDNWYGYQVTISLLPIEE